MVQIERRLAAVDSVIVTFSMRRIRYLWFDVIVASLIAV